MNLEDYIIKVLMRDLVGHDNQPSAFLIFLFIYHHWVMEGERPVRLSLSRIADGTGLSKSSAQNALRLLKRRNLLDTVRKSETAVPEYAVLPYWRKHVQSG